MKANAKGGIKFDGEKPDYSLVPFGAMDEVVKVLTYGAKKYDRFNWEKVENRRYEAAALRHISAYMQGEKIDPESGISHLAHAACSIMFLIDFDLKQEKTDEDVSVIVSTDALGTPFTVGEYESMYYSDDSCYNISLDDETITINIADDINDETK